jgi:hypothetical protein
VKVVFFWVKAILYTFFAHYFALSFNTTGWNPITRYHATTFLCLSLPPVLRFRLVAVLLVSVLSRLRFVNGIVRVVVSYFVIHYCLAVYSQYYFILVFSFIGIVTVVPDPCPYYMKNSDIGKYISNQPILSLKVFMSF